MTEIQENKNECIICLEIINLENLFIQDFCNCKNMNFHLICYNKYFLENHKCMICKQFHFQYIMNLLIYDYEKAIKIYKKLLNDNYLHICNLSDINISNHIKIKINTKYNTTYLKHYGINEDILDGLKKMLDKTKYKKQVILEIKKSIDMEFD